MPFALFAALAASLGLHAVALFVPDIELLPASEPMPMTVAVTLQPRRTAEAKAPERKPAPQKKTVARPAPANAPAQVAATAAANVAQHSEALVSTSMPDAGNEGDLRGDGGEAGAQGAAAAPELTSPALPPRGSISYVVMGGDGTTLIGSAEQRWEMADGRYRLVSVMETSGVAALLKPVRLETESSGILGAQGLEPERYVSRRIGKERVDEVSFDRAAGVLRFGRGGEAALPEGVQDLLSFNYQLGWLAKTGDMAIATGRKLGVYRLELLGKEWLETPYGMLWTLHFRASGETTTEVWLASEQYLLPVKIRHIDKKGERYEQIVQSMEIATQ